MREQPLSSHSSASTVAEPLAPVRVIFLGGLGEIGRNCACIEVEGRLIVLDVGIMFPEPDMPGVDLVLPDFTFLRENAHRVDGVVLTHGHEDHVGGLSYLLRDLEVPVYGSPLTVGLAAHRVREAGQSKRATFIEVADGETVEIGPCKVEFIPVTHSVPSAMAIAFHTPQGVVLHSGDFKIDLNPVDGRRTDLARIGELAKTKGIRLLLSDSTNAEEPGFTQSESSVGETLRRLFAMRDIPKPAKPSPDYIEAEARAIERDPARLPYAIALVADRLGEIYPTKLSDYEAKRKERDHLEQNHENSDLGYLRFLCAENPQAHSFFFDRFWRLPIDLPWESSSSLK